MTNIVANGNAYSDDGSSSRDMQGGGFRQWLLPMLGDAMLQTGQGASAASQAQGIAVQASESAEASAQEAADALDLVLATGSGWSPVLKIAVDGKRYVLQVADWTGGRGTKPAVGYMAATGLVPTVAGGLNIRGAVAYADLTGKPTLGTAAALDVPAAPATAATAAQVVRGDDPRLAGGASSLPREARSSNTKLVKTDQGKLIDYTGGGFTQTFDPCATLGSGWIVWLRNSSTVEVLLYPSASETIDGVSSFYMYPGELRVVQCDGASLRTIILTPLLLQRTASFDFIKPPGYRAFDVDLRGATGGGGSGGAGGYSTSAYHAAGGGGASGGLGARSTAIFPAEILQPVTPFAVGAAGLGAAGVSAPAETPINVIVDGVNGSAGGGTTVTIDGSTFIAGGGPGGSGGKGTSGASSGSPGGAVSAGVASMTGKYSTGQSANRYRYLGDASFGMSNPGVAGGFASGGARIPGGLGGLAVTDALASGSTGAGGDGGDSRLGGVESVSRPGLNGVHGMVIIKGVV